MVSEHEHKSVPRSLLEATVGRMVHVGIGPADDAQWYLSRLEDFDPDNGRLTVAWPTEQRSLVPLHPGQLIAVEVPASDDALYASEMQVAGMARREAAYLELVPDGPWRRVQRRQDVRLPVDIEPSLARLRTMAGWTEFPAVIVNISAGGMLVRSDEVQLQAGDLMELTFELPTSSSELRVRAIVRHARPVERGVGDVWQAGCQFRDLRPADSERIVQFIFAQQRMTARRQRGR